MNYRNPRLQRLLAAEYALGTLAGRARARFRGLLAGDMALRAEVREWDARLAELAAQLPPVAPREIVWVSLVQRLEAEKTAAAARIVPLRRDAAPAPGTRARVPLAWRAWAGFATAASLVLAVALFRERTQPPPEPERIVVQVPVPSYVALVQVPGEAAAWTVSFTPDRKRLVLAVLGEPTLAADKDYELWWLTDAGVTSLGTLPRSASVERPIPASIAVADGAKVAVSLEQAGGSPTGSPQGPVLLAAPLAKTI